MANVLIVAYLLIVVALIAVILLQRSEGGGLGMGTSTGLMTVRGSANLLTRTTAILAALFFATAIGLTILSEIDRPNRSILERAADGVGEGAGAPTSVLDALNQLQGETAPAAPMEPAPPAVDPALPVPVTEAPAAPETSPPPAAGETQSAPATPPAAPTD